ncbi:MAG TPA: hypothetical protein VG347_10410 [Verrucomicrobiae bacterium]|nr:hypothetical protein [Verrucomicrobiae bacterium]
MKTLNQWQGGARLFKVTNSVRLSLSLGHFGDVCLLAKACLVLTYSNMTAALAELHRGILNVI